MVRTVLQPMRSFPWASFVCFIAEDACLIARKQLGGVDQRQISEVALSSAASTWMMVTCEVVSNAIEWDKERRSHCYNWSLNLDSDTIVWSSVVSQPNAVITIQMRQLQ